MYFILCYIIFELISFKHCTILKNKQNKNVVEGLFRPISCLILSSLNYNK